MSILVDNKVVLKSGDRVRNVELRLTRPPSLQGFNSSGKLLIYDSDTGYLMTQDEILRQFPVDAIRILDFNDRNQVLFYNWNQGELFLDDERIIGVGDTLDGAKVTDVLLQLTASLNDFGDIALVAGFDDGVARLVISSIPEPASNLLFLMGLIVVSRRIRMRIGSHGVPRSWNASRLF
jgi:hypothetical protein